MVHSELWSLTVLLCSTSSGGSFFLAQPWGPWPASSSTESPEAGFTFKHLYVLAEKSSWGRKGALRKRGMRRRGNGRWGRERAQERQLWGCEIADIAKTKENKEQSCLMRRMVMFLWPLMGLAARFYFLIITESICNFDLSLEYLAFLSCHLLSCLPFILQPFSSSFLCRPSQGDPWEVTAHFPTAIYQFRQLHCSTPIKCI